MRIGIITYGNVLSDPGYEIKKQTINTINGIITPFNVEFARKSSTRGNAPTLTVVKNIGTQVKGSILELSPSTTQYLAADLLWRRETRQSLQSNKHYLDSSSFVLQIIIETISGYIGFDILVYAIVEQNISSPNANLLAELAIDSATKEDIAKEHKDGISYLFDVKARGISTPLLEPYENEILRRTDSIDLIQAFEKVSNLNWSTKGEKNNNLKADFRVRCFICGRSTSVPLLSKEDDGLPRICIFCSHQKTPGNPNLKPASRVEEILDDPEEIE